MNALNVSGVHDVGGAGMPLNAAGECAINNYEAYVAAWKECAAAFGLSLASVSNALNGFGRTSRKLSETVSGRIRAYGSKLCGSVSHATFEWMTAARSKDAVRGRKRYERAASGATAFDRWRQASVWSSRSRTWRAAEPKPRKRIGHHFAGRLGTGNINQILGKEPK